MTTYSVEVNIIENLLVDADDMEHAYEEAVRQISEGFDVEPFQVNVVFAKEVK